MARTKLFTLCFVVAFSSATLLFPLTLLAEEEAFVQVRKTELRTEPDYLSPSVTSLAYGDRVTLKELTKGWLKVNVDGKEGFLHSSALTKTEIELSEIESASLTKGAKPIGVRDSEVVLAGKGIKSKAEQKLKKQNPKVDFEAVTALEEKSQPSRAEFLSFANEGGLKTE